jgi:hypothetical protein
MLTRVGGTIVEDVGFVVKENGIEEIAFCQR